MSAACCDVLERLEHLRLRVLEAGEARDGEAMRELWSLVVHEPLLPAMRADERFERLRAFFAPRWQKHIADREHEVAARLLAANDGSTVSVLAEEGYRSIEAELGLLCGEPAASAVVVGCGPYPETLMQLARCGAVTGKIVGVDRSADAVTSASAMLDRSRLSIEAEVVVGEGADYDFGGVDLVVLANGLSHKQDVFTQVARTVRRDARLIVRTPMNLGELFYDGVILPEGWRVVRSVETTGLSRAVLLQAVAA